MSVLATIGGIVFVFSSGCCLLLLLYSAITDTEPEWVRITWLIFAYIWVGTCALFLTIGASYFAFCLLTGRTVAI